MKILQQQILENNNKNLHNTNQSIDFLCNNLNQKGFDIENIINKISAFQIAIPSWALGAGGTRFGRFSYGGEPTTLLQKIDDVAIINDLTKNANSISLHIPWDIPTNFQEIKSYANTLKINFDAVNSNTFQDQASSKHSYKYGSLCNTNKEIRQQAISHNIDVINIGEKLGSKSLTVWLADGANFPGQHNFQKSLQNTLDSLKEIYNHLPQDWKIFIEYKPYEPAFYSTVIPDWGTSFLLANECGNQAFTLVDLGHHLPNTNIEQIVSTLMYKSKLGGFHFNDSKYGDDDITVGSIKPYNLFLIFKELIYGINNNLNNPPLSWMIDASHNIKDPLEDLLQSIDAILIAYTQALLVNFEDLEIAQQENDTTLCQEILQNAFRTDVRPLIQKARLKNNASINPLQTYRQLKVREQLIKQRGLNSKASGL